MTSVSPDGLNSNELEKERELTSKGDAIAGEASRTPPPCSILCLIYKGKYIFLLNIPSNTKARTKMNGNTGLISEGDGIIGI